MDGWKYGTNHAGLDGSCPLDEELWCAVLHGWLIVIPDVTAKEDNYWVNLTD